MPPRNACVYFLFVLCLGAWGCSSEDPPSDEDTGPIEKPCEGYASARCETMNRCAPALFAIEHGDLDACRSELRAWCVHVGHLPGVRVGAKAIGACASTFRSLSCAAWQARRDDPFCDAPGGSLSVDEPCISGYQCASKACYLDAQGVCGVCQPTAGVGDPCRQSMECPATSACVGYHCLKTMALGEECGSGRPCAGQLLCLSGTCQQSPALHDPCIENTCNNRLATECVQGVCEPLETAATGQACGLINGKTVYCGRGTCSSQGVCVAPVPEGRPCQDSSGPTCLQPAVCVDGWCKIPQPSMCQ